MDQPEGLTPDRLSRSKDVELEFHRAAGPGGQNVNKVSTAVRLRFDLKNSDLLNENVKARLAKAAGRKMTEDGQLIIEAKRFRTQEQNREDALTRLAALIKRAQRPPKPRRKTKPPAAAKRRRLSEKRHRARIKEKRGPVDPSQ